MAVIPMDIEGMFLVESFKPRDNYYGEKNLDIAMLRVNFKGLEPIQTLFGYEFNEGEELHYAGFHMGTTALRIRGNGHIHQLRPILKKGIVSTILPFPCPSPHLVLLDSAAQGGVSGGPVFARNGMIVGMVASGFPDTSLTYAIPVEFLSDAIGKIAKSDFGKHKIEQNDLDEWMASEMVNATEKVIKPTDPNPHKLEPLKPEEITKGSTINPSSR